MLDPLHIVFSKIHCNGSQKDKGVHMTLIGLDLNRLLQQEKSCLNEPGIVVLIVFVSILNGSSVTIKISISLLLGLNPPIASEPCI